MSEQPGSEAQEKFTIKQRRFIDEYMVDFNGSRAARDAGFSKNSAAEIAHEYLRKPHIKAEIERRLKLASLGPDETKKMITDIAKGNISKYMKVVETEYTPRVKKPVSELIEKLKLEIDFEGQYAVLADFTEEEYEEHSKQQQQRRNKLIRLELELKLNPKATRIVSGETKLVKTVELDLVALAADKETGKIKAFKMTPAGPQVELYEADGALMSVAKMHGLLKDKVDVTMNGNIDPESFLKANNTNQADD